MEEKKRAYIAIDLKSFYASVECVDRGLNPLTTNLVVANLSRTEKTICLAVTPSLKQHGISGRARLFEVVERVREVNEERRRRLPSGCFTGSSSDDVELKARPDLKLNYLVAPPRMARYVEVSRQIYNIYLRHVAPEDIHPYSVDEVFMDVTDYLHYNRLTPHEMAIKMIREVLRETGITATAGIGTNLYLAKVAMDIMAKKTQPDADGVRIAELDEMSYRRLLWDHRPLTAFWRVGRGIAQKLQAHNEDLLYRLFGVNAELLIDHAWGWEPCTIAQVKAYRPETNSFSSGQVLSCAYDARKARVVVQEMADGMALSLLGRRMVTSQVVLTVNYDRENLERPDIRERYTGEVTSDWYGRPVPKHAHGTETLERPSSSPSDIIGAAMTLFDRIVNPDLLVRRLNLTVAHVVSEDLAAEQQEKAPQQLDLFTDYEAERLRQEREEKRRSKERRLEEARLAIKRRFGANAILKGLNFEEGATAKERNGQIGGHKA